MSSSGSEPADRRRDPVAQETAVAPKIPAPSRSFEGVSNSDNVDATGFSVLPPDTEGDIGPNHYVQWVNISFSVFDRAGTKLYGPAAGNTLWSGFGGLCETTNQGDPIVLYDHLADRWFFSQFAFNTDPLGAPVGPFSQCIAVSKTEDPLGPYSLYEFFMSDTKLNDYAKFGVWPDAYYMSINQFTSTGYAGAGAVAFERDKMLLGQPARMVFFDLFSANPNFGGMLPADLDGPPPPANSPNLFVEMDDQSFGFLTDRLSMWEFHVDWTNTSNSTFGIAGQPNRIIDTLSSPPLVAFDVNMCDFDADCIPQPPPPGGTNQGLDALSDRLMYRLQYRNFGSHQTLVTNHTVDVDGADHAGVRWYELRNSGAGWVINQQGTYAPDADHRWMGSVAMNGNGDMALGYSISGNSTYPSIRYTGRQAGDPPGTMPQGEATLIAGGGAQTHFSGRWGDYTMMAVDPLDDTTFWYTNEYYSSTSTGSWRTRIGSFRVTLADLSVTKTDSPDPAALGQPLVYTVTATNNGPAQATGVNVTDTLPAGVTFNSVSSSQGSCGQSSGTVTCNMGTILSGSSAKVTITVTPNQLGALTNTVTATANEEDPNSSNNTASASTTVVLASADLSVGKLDSPDPVIVGQLLNYTVMVNNNGPSAATSVSVTDTLPAGVTFNSVSSSQGSCGQSAGKVTCNLGTISSGSSITITIAVTPNKKATIVNTVTATGAEPDPNSSNNTATAPTTVACRTLAGGWMAYSPSFSGGVYVAAGDFDADGCDEIVTGAGQGGGPHVQAFRADGSVMADLFAYGSAFTGGVRVAAGDVDGDGKDELITAPGPGGGPHVRVWDLFGSTFVEQSSFFAYSPSFTGGVFVAAGDVTGDGKAEIVTGADAGGGPHVMVFTGSGSPIGGFFAYGSAFTGGVRVAAVDLDGGKAEIITAPGPGGGPHVRGFKADGTATSLNFMAYSISFTGGVFIGAGELVPSNSGNEIVTGPDRGGGPHVRIFSNSGADVSGGEFFAYGTSFTGGVRVAASDVNGNGNGEVVTGPGPSGGPHIRLFE